MSDARFDGELQMNNLNVGNNLKLLQSTVTRVLLQSAKIGGILDIEGPNRHRAADPNPPPPRPKNYPAQFVDLSGAAVGTLSLGSSWYGPVDAPANWGAGARLTLTNASVNTLVDGLCANSGPNCVADTWPEHLDLTGFTFQQFLDRDAGKEVDAADRSISWWTKWLGRQERYSPQAYEYIASMFLKLGYKDRAEDILYASKNRELGNTPFPGNIKLWLERVLIGYGYRTRYAVLWVAGFIILGAGMLRLSGEGLRNKMPYGAAFSFDMLLPIVRLRDYHYRVELNGWVRYYFYFHKLMGYLLASFLIAGLSGLTK